MNHGTVNHNGKILTLQQEAYITDNIDYADGNLFEMQALAKDDAENEYLVKWVFEHDEDKNLDDYDYSCAQEIIEID